MLFSVEELLTEFQKFNKTVTLTESGKPKTKKYEYKKTIYEYLEETDPKTGKKYVIPFLSPRDTGYPFKYIDFMMLKERDEKTFNKIINWG